MTGKKDAEPAVVVQRSHDLLLWLLPKMEKFARCFRFSVGERTVRVGLDLLLALVEAAYRADETQALEWVAEPVHLAAGARRAMPALTMLKRGLTPPRLSMSAIALRTPAPDV